MFFRSIYNVNPFNCTINGDCSLRDIDVTPLQSTDFPYTKSRTKTDVDTQSSKGEMTLNMIEYFLVIGNCQYFQFFGCRSRRVFDVPLLIIHPFIFYAEFHNHFQYNQYILHGFHTQPILNFLQNKVLHSLFMERITFSKVWKNMILQDKHISSHCGLLHIRLLVLFPCNRDFGTVANIRGLFL